MVCCDGWVQVCHSGRKVKKGREEDERTIDSIVSPNTYDKRTHEVERERKNKGESADKSSIQPLLSQHPRSMAMCSTS